MKTVPLDKFEKRWGRAKRKQLELQANDIKAGLAVISDDALRKIRGDYVGIKEVAGVVISKASRIVNPTRNVSLDVYAHRLRTCMKCEDMTVLAGRPTCGNLFRKTGRTCGCFVEEKAKDTQQSCPQGKW